MEYDFEPRTRVTHAISGLGQQTAGNTKRTESALSPAATSKRETYA